MTITRRAFGAGVLAVLTAPFIKPIPTAAAQPVVINRIAIAGGGYHALPKRLASLAGGLTLKREPENPFDANAIAILDRDGTHLGYVPRRLAETIAPVIDAGEAIGVRLSGETISPENRADVVRTDWCTGDPILELTRAA